MLKARWSGYEIDSSEAAYEVPVQVPEEMGTLVRGLLSSGYFVRSCYLRFDEPMIRLRDFITEHGDLGDKLTAKTAEYLDKQIAKFDPTSWRGSRIGVLAVQTILNYVGAHRQELLDGQIFRFELMDEQREMSADYDYEFTPGNEVDETIYYSEQEIPLDGVVLYLGCSLVGADKLSPEEQRWAYRIVHDSYEEVGLLDDLAGWSFGPPRDYVLEDISRRQHLSLRVRLNPNATFTVTGRWMDDGQFIYPYYEYLLELAAKKAAARIKFHMIY
ncbi:MAG: hypothetical protein ACE5F6_05520 [Anaerolineae bacterium]